MAEILNKPFAIQQGPDAEKIDYNFDILFRRLRNLESGGSSVHNILSETHADSDPATLVDGDILIVSGGLLTRLPIGANGDFLRVDGLPAWDALDAVDLPAHDLLGLQHGDTTPDAPELGDIITGEQDTEVEDVNDSEYWIDGATLDFISTGVDPGTQEYWLDGAASNALLPSVGVGDVTWRRKDIGSEGQVLTVRSGKPAWADSAVGGDGAVVIQTANYTGVWGALTTVIFSGSEYDDAGFFSSASPTRVTIPSDGWYTIVGTVTASYAHFGLLWVMLYVNGVLTRTHQGGMTNVSAGWGGTYEPRQVVGVLKLTAGDYIELKFVASRTSGAASTMIGGSAYCNLSLVKV